MYEGLQKRMPMVISLHWLFEIGSESSSCLHPPQT